MPSRELFVNAMKSKIAAPYIWGGNGPNSFDCSGFILWCLSQSGFTFGDMRSGDIARLFKNKEIDRKDAQPGCLFFYGKPVHHVMSCVNRWHDGHIWLIGARGGQENTKDLEIAYIQKACVDIVPGEYWASDLTLVVDPFKE